LLFGDFIDSVGLGKFALSFLATFFAFMFVIVNLIYRHPFNVQQFEWGRPEWYSVPYFIIGIPVQGWMRFSVDLVGVLLHPLGFIFKTD